MKMAITSAVSILAIVLWPAFADAKQKKVSNGCTAGQIQSAAAADCGHQMEQDIINNAPTMHALYCSSSGRMLCCEYVGQSIVDGTCTVVGRRLPRTPTGKLDNLPTLKQQ
jgi:hypothetical protein